MIDQETLKTFDEIYDKTYADILKYVICNCSNIEDVKDIVQNIYLELLKVLNNKITYNNVNAYIMGIAKNKVKEYYQFNYKAKIISLFSNISLIEIIPVESPDSYKLIVSIFILAILRSYIELSLTNSGATASALNSPWITSAVIFLLGKSSLITILSILFKTPSAFAISNILSESFLYL